MNEKSNHKAGFGRVEDRIRAFRDRMAPALHLFPQDITEKLTEGGFFIAPASTKYHGAYEGGLFDHKRRVVYFSVRAALMLRAYMEQRRGGEALFASSRAPYGPMSPRAIERAVEAVGVRAGERRRIHPHILRHTFATNALHGGMDITVIQHLMGHTDPKTTLIYAELRPDAVKYAYERVIA